MGLAFRCALQEGFHRALWWSLVSDAGISWAAVAPLSSSGEAERDSEQDSVQVSHTAFICTFLLFSY